MKSKNRRRIFYRMIAWIWMVFSSVQIINANPQDSLKTKWIDGKKYQLHKVVAKDTWTGVSKKYNLTVEELQKANTGVSILKVGQIIQVPVNAVSTDNKIKPVELSDVKISEIKSGKTVKPSATDKNKYHTVAKGETLYRISKENGITVDELKKLNKLSDNNVSIGQKLIVGSSANVTSLKETAIAEPVAEESSKPVEKKADEIFKHDDDSKELKSTANTIIKQESDKPSTIDSPSVYSSIGNSKNSELEKDLKTGISVEKIIENGVATWITDGELNQNKFYAMHRTAPVGTIIKVTNKMNNNSVFVKVVGLLPDTGDNANTIIKITQAAAQRIGVLDQRFQAELSYGITK